MVGTGAVGSGYLLARSFALLASPHPRMLDLCAALFSVSCDPALLERRTWILGVPAPGWGLVLFTTVAALLLLARYVREAFAAEALLAAWIVTLGGAVSGSVLLIAAGSPRGALCPLCLILEAAAVLLLLTLHRSSARSPGEQLRLLRSGAGWLVRSTPEAVPVRWKVLGLGSAALVAVVTYQWVYVESALRRAGTPPASRPDDVIAAYLDSPRVTLPTSDEDPHLGSLDAPVRLVVFASLRCPACRAFAPALDRLSQRFGDRLLVVFKHYPLSSRCNGRLKEDQQPGACEVAWAAEAARRQGGFWAFLDAILGGESSPDPAAIARTVRELGLDPAQFAADRQSHETLERVAADVELGTRLGIPGTPAVFLDGRLVRRADEATLEVLIRRELERAGEASERLDPASATADGIGSEATAFARTVVRHDRGAP